MKIICIGRNYKAHAKELHNAVPEEPVFFLKPDSAMVTKNKPVYYPDFTKELHHEVEIIVRINRLGKNIAEKFAPKYYNEIGIGIDFTARDLQSELKTKSLPWEKAKGFDGSAPMSQFYPVEQFGKIDKLNFQLDINGETRQQGNTKDMLFNVNQLIAYVSKYMTLKIGDLIFTGTPAGVGPVQIGDKLSCSIEGQNLLEFEVK